MFFRYTFNGEKRWNKVRNQYVYFRNMIPPYHLPSISRVNVSPPRNCSSGAFEAWNNLLLTLSFTQSLVVALSRKAFVKRTDSV